MGLLGKIGDLLGKVVGVVDEVITSDEERLRLKAPLFEMQAKILGMALEAEKQILDARTKIIVAETQSDSWLTKNWRPITALAFVAMMGASWIGWGPPVPDWMPTTINIMLGGYIGGRTVEKVASLAGALKAEEKV